MAEIGKNLTKGIDSFMGHLLKPVKVVTKEGELEIAISIELNINVNSEGLNVVAQAEAKPLPKKKEETIWEIPDFDSSPKLNFGKKDKL